MKVWKNFVNFYLQGSIHVAFAVMALAAVVAMEMHLPLSALNLTLLFTATISGYNFVKFAGIAKLYHKSLTRNLKLIQVFSFVAGAILIYLLFQQSEQQLWLLVVLALVNFLYAIPFLPKDKNLRSLSGIKIFIIASIWALTTVLYPHTNTISSFYAPPVLGRLTQIFALVIAMTLPFEIRDVKDDHAELGTLPQTLGIAKTKTLGYILAAAFLILSFVLNRSLRENTPEIIVFLSLVFFIARSAPSRRFYFTAFWVEGLPIAWLLLEELLKITPT